MVQGLMFHKEILLLIIEITCPHFLKAGFEYDIDNDFIVFRKQIDDSYITAVTFAVSEVQQDKLCLLLPLPAKIKYKLLKEAFGDLFDLDHSLVEFTFEDLAQVRDFLISLNKMCDDHFFHLLETEGKFDSEML